MELDSDVEPEVDRDMLAAAMGDRPGVVGNVVFVGMGEGCMYASKPSSSSSSPFNSEGFVRGDDISTSLPSPKSSPSDESSLAGRFFLRERLDEEQRSADGQREGSTTRTLFHSLSHSG